MATKEIELGKCPSCKDENVLVLVDTESGQVVVNNVEQKGEWKERAGNVKVFVASCGSPLRSFSNDYCEQLIELSWYCNGEIIANYLPMRRHKYTSHSFCGKFAGSEEFVGSNSIYIESEIDGGKVLSEDMWVENMTGRVRMNVIIPAETLGKVKVVPNMGTYFTCALEPLNGAIALAGARALLQPIIEDLIGVCDIKCESNPEGGNIDSPDYTSHKRLEAVMAELAELSAEFIRVNNEEE